MSKFDLKKAGHPTQLCSAEEMRLVGGKGDSMRLVQMNSGEGLFVTVCPDRCLDISRLSYKGINLSFFSPVGYVAPQYYNKDEFMRSFTAGFITTCGLRNVGVPAVDDGEETVMHGRISNVPCENLAYDADVKTGDVTLSGKMNQAIIFGEKLQLNRKYTVNGKTILLEDTVTNLGDVDSPLMLLYHTNFGYPLLDEGVNVWYPSKETIARDAEAQKGINEWDQIPAPIVNYAEQCFYHKFGVIDGKSAFAVYNSKLKVGVKVTFNADGLNCFTQWKQVGVRDYVLGCEPATCRVEGRDKMRADGDLQFIRPDEVRNFTLKIEIIDGDQEAKEVKDYITRLKEQGK